MWIPGTTAMLFRFIFRRGYKEIGWKIGNKKFWWLAFLIPLSVPSVTYLIAFLSGNATLTNTGFVSVIYRDPLNLLTFFWPAWFPHSLGLELLVRSIIVLTFGLFVGFVLAFGEELGWRGYLQPRIKASGFKFPYALCGLIWAGWHFPFLWYFYNPTTTQIYQAIFFTINITLLGIIVGHLQMNSGSIWISTMVHAAHNSVNFELFDAVISCNQCELFVSENGLLMGIIYGVIALWMLRAQKPEILRDSSVAKL